MGMNVRSHLGRVAAFTFLTLVVPTLALAAGDTIKLKRTGKAGDVQVLQITAKGEAEGFEVVFEAKSKETLKKLSADGVQEVESLMLGGKLSVAGQEQEMEAEEHPSTSTLDKRGFLTAYESGNEDDEDGGDQARIGATTAIIYPEKDVKVGDKWSFTGKGVEKLGTRDCKYDFELVALDKVDTTETARIKISYKETEGEDAVESNGTIWVNIATGSVIKFEVKVKNLPLGGEAFPGEFTITATPTKE